MTSPSTPPPDIELRQVRRVYGGVVAVDDVSLAVSRGEFFSLLGPSGCGKTTLLRMIAGFVVPSAGEIRIRGRSVTDVPAYKRETNMVFQQLALFPHLNVFDNIAFALRLKHRPRDEVAQRVKRALEQVGLVGFDARRTHELSGGQQQRVAIARALVNEPAALLLDEPLGALDLKLRNQMQVELKAMQERSGTTFVYVTHDQGEAMAMSDRIAVMRDGRVEQVGHPDEIYRHPANRFVAQFIGEANIFDGVVVARDGDGVLIDAAGVRLRSREAVEVGSVAALSVRPENVRLVTDGETIENRIGVRVESAVFLGPHVRYLVMTAGGQKIIATAPANGSPPRAGDAIEIGWRTADAVLLPP